MWEEVWPPVKPGFRPAVRGSSTPPITTVVAAVPAALVQTRLLRAHRHGGLLRRREAKGGLLSS